MILAKEKYAIEAEESYLNKLSHEKWLGKRHPADSDSDEGIKRSSPDSGNISDSSYDATVGYQWIDLKERHDHLFEFLKIFFTIFTEPDSRTQQPILAIFLGLPFPTLKKLRITL